MVQWTPTEHLYTVRDIARYNSQTGTTTVVNHLVYDAFGKLTSETNPAVDSLFLFTGRPSDQDSQLQNNLNRWYDASVGRWLSEDPMGFAAGDGNLYRFVKGSPLLNADPYGLESSTRESRHDHLVGYGGDAYLQATLLSDLVRDREGNCGIRLRVRLRRLLENPGYREMWNSLEQEVPDEWSREAWGSDSAGNKWLWPDLAKLLNGDYGGFDPIKRVDNDYAIVIVRHYDAEGNEVGQPQASRRWRTIGKPSGEVSHAAGVEEFRIWPPCSATAGVVRVWVVMCDTWGDPLYPGSPLEGPEDAYGRRGGSTIAYFELHYRHDPRSGLKWSISSRTSDVPPTMYDYN